MSDAVSLLDISPLLDKAASLRESREMSILMSAGLQGIAVDDWAGFAKDKWDRIRLSEEWANWRQAIFARDNFSCVECGTRKGPFDPHHILRKSDRPDLLFDVNNGVTLCRPCHTLTFGREPEFAERFQAIVADAALR